MQIEQQRWTADEGWSSVVTPKTATSDAQLVLVFGAPAALRSTPALADLHRRYPTATFLGCSTSGEIAGERVLDDSVVATAVRFERTTVRAAWTPVAGEADSVGAGSRLAAQLPHEGLRHVLVLSEGLHINGSGLVEGLTRGLPDSVTVTGGLAGDGTAFGETVVVHGTTVEPGVTAAVGLYGSALHVGCASLGGFDTFGPERLVTRAEGNVLYELDGQSALELYKRYLGEHAKALPASGLLFPLHVRAADSDSPSVRTILAVDEAHQSLTFAGDIPQGGYARLMKGNFDRIIDGASLAAQTSVQDWGEATAELALLVSCVGRRLMLKQRTEEEVEAVRLVVGPAAAMAGFYSYGEISPFSADARCQLHNQTMTITTLREAA